MGCAAAGERRGLEAPDRVGGQARRKPAPPGSTVLGRIAEPELAAGDEQFKTRHFKQAFRLYSEAYKAAVALPPKPR